MFDGYIIRTQFVTFNVERFKKNIAQGLFFSIYADGGFCDDMNGLRIYKNGQLMDFVKRTDESALV